MIPGLTLHLMIGTVRPEPAPKEVVDALVSVSATQADTSASGFQLVFHASNRSRILREYLKDGFFSPPRRVVLCIDAGGKRSVVMDGIITRNELAVSSNPGASTLTVTGSDLTQIMDLIDFSGLPWPMPPDARVLLMVAKYAIYGIAPIVIPSALLAMVNPLERIDKQRGTDLSYIRQLAGEVGYVFYIAPQSPGAAVAYWGPQIKAGPVQSALSVNFDGASNLDALNLSFDGIQKTVFVFWIQERNSGVPIPVPIADMSPLNPPLGKRLPIPLSYTRLSNLARDGANARFEVAAATMRGLARAAERADVISGSGSIDVGRYGRLLEPRSLVAVRGAGPTYDGTYYVKSVASQIQRGSFKQNFRLTRNAFEPISQEVPV